METQSLLDVLDEETKDNIAKALWMRKFNIEEILMSLLKN